MIRPFRQVLSIHFKVVVPRAGSPTDSSFLGKRRDALASAGSLFGSGLRRVGVWFDTLIGTVLVAEDAGPFAESQIGCDDNRGRLVELGDQMKQQLPGRFRKRQVAEFIERMATTLCAGLAVLALLG